MLDFSQTKERCTGCSACAAVCPVGCITMQPDPEGFLYPTASDQCIHCGKCQRVCPVLNPPPAAYFPQTACAAVSRDYKTWKSSASGGAFSEICSAWADADTLIAGAAWDGLYVRHICVKGAGAIAPLRKSKYVASDPGDVFSQIRQHLLQGGSALFCGTPCQVAGLKAFLGKAEENLLTIDLICHGVGSPSVFAHCMDAIGKQFGSPVTAYEFRTKRKIHETDYLSRVSFGHGKKDLYLQKDPYIQLFLSQNGLRPSCSDNCPFRNQQRQGDITIADFKGLTSVFPHLLGAKKNYSTIVVNTNKGADVVSQLSQTMNILPCALDDIKKYNPLFCTHTWSSKGRDCFFADFIQSPDAAIENWTSPAQVCPRTIKGILQELIPEGLRRAALQCIQKVKNK